MKKYLKSVLLLVAAIVSASMFVACGEDDKTNELNPVQKEEPAEKVEMGHYVVKFPSLMILSWPDNQAGIDEQYKAYQKRITDALKYEEGKQYKWSDIEADKDRLQKVFDGFDGFEYTVKACNNHLNYLAENISFGAYKEGSSKADITFGERKITCKVDFNEGETCQLYVVITSYEATLPSAEEYCANLKKLFTDALRDVFADEYGKVEVSGTSPRTEYYNLANFAGNSDELKERVAQACDDVKMKIPALPENVKEEAQASNAKIPYLFDVTVFAYNLDQASPARTEKVVFHHITDVK